MYMKKLVKIMVSTAMATVLATTPTISSNPNMMAMAAEADSNGSVTEDGVLTSYEGNIKKYNNSNSSSGSAITTNEKLYLDVKGTGFTIRSSSGNYAKVKGIQVVEGNLDIRLFSAEVGGSTLTFEIPQLEGESYTVDLEDGTQGIVLRNRDKKNGFYCSVKAEKAISITIDPNGVMSTHTKDGEAVCQTIAYTKNTLNWGGTDITGIGAAYELSEVDGKLQIVSEKDARIDLSVTDFINELNFQGVKLEDGIALVSCDEKETSDQNLYIVSDSKGNEIAKKEMGFKVSFYPLNNTTIEDIKNVVSGSAIAEPAKPELEGYQFAGWYTSRDCKEDEKWDFDEDRVTQNISLWAKWIQETVTPTPKPTPSITKPSRPSNVKLKNSSRKTMKVTWKKVSKATGYKIVYSTDKKFSKANTKTVTVGKTKNSVTIKKLEKGKNYYVKVCAYKKSGKTAVYGKYSTVKKIKIKK